MNRQLWTVALAISGGLSLAAQNMAGRDTSPHTVTFIAVDTDVKLEVLDWGGSGRPLVLLAGLGATAHVFDELAQKLSSRYRVYGITRRGFGASSIPASGYTADRLGDDVLAVVDSLKLERPVIAGHSIAGQELSSIGSRHPQRVAGLIYLDAGYSYAYYDRSRGDLLIDIYEVEKRLAQFHPGNGPDDPNVYLTLIRELLGTNLPALEKVLREAKRNCWRYKRRRANRLRQATGHAARCPVLRKQSWRDTRSTPISRVLF
jgi:pimeloyl-ACP methyl ester carboxylesterase